MSRECKARAQLTLERGALDRLKSETKHSNNAETHHKQLLIYSSQCEAIFITNVLNPSFYCPKARADPICKLGNSGSVVKINCVMQDGGIRVVSSPAN